jgi:allophanate hydrolase
MAATTLLAVCGAHLSGQPLNPFLIGLGARFVGVDRTAQQYRMVALPSHPDVPDTGSGPRPGVPPRPGLIRRAEGGGSIELEVYRLPISALGALLVTVAPPLAIGSLTLASGQQILGFVCEGYAEMESTDITHFGTWRAYLAHHGDSDAGHRTSPAGSPVDRTSR